MQSLPQKRPEVVIVGAGFGGLNAAQCLRDAAVNVTVIDRRNHHLFQPLLYQVATAGLSAGDIAYPIRSILSKQKNVRVLLAEAVSVDPDRRRVVLSDGEVPYDYLILAPGVRHSYFGRNEWERDAPGLKSLEDALEIRRRILVAYEEAEREPDEIVRRSLLTFVVIGGGPTGVEVAGAIAEIAHQVMRDDFRSINPADTRIVLVEGGPRLLAAFPERLAKKAEAELKRRGVEVVTGAQVTSIDSISVTAGDRQIYAATKIWAAGIEASLLARSLGVPVDRAGRVLVGPDLSVPERPEILVVGDLACFTHQGGKPLPGVATVAIQQGRYAAERIEGLLAGRDREPFRYRDHGSMATIGRSSAVAVILGLQLTGLIAWLIWVFVHIAELIDFRNRLAVLFDWSWSYFRFYKPARIIFGASDQVLGSWHELRRGAEGPEKRQEESSEPSRRVQV